MIGKYEPSDGDSICQNCHKENVIWYAENELFNEINGSPNGVLCPKCFEEKAAEKGFCIMYKAEKHILKTKRGYLNFLGFKN